jgi:hypothetical protein
MIFIDVHVRETFCSPHPDTPIFLPYLHRLWSALTPRVQGAVEDSGIALFVNAQ